MPQGWDIDEVANTITFLEAPPTGVNNIVVKEYPAGGTGGTDAWAYGAWSGKYGYPSEVEFYSDRLFWAGTPSDPQTVWASQTGDYPNHGKSTPIVDSDAVSFTINARQVNAVMDLVPLDKLIILAKGGEFLLTGGQDEVITPSTINVKPQSYRGTSGLQAKVVGETAIMVQEQGQHVYDIGYRFEADAYKPQDISVWSSHLVEGYVLTRMEWSPAPWSCVWFMRDDGTKIGCTYMPEQEVIGWHRHDTGRDIYANGEDEIEDIVCLPGDKQTEVVYIVKRIIDGQVRRYIEQMAPEFVSDIRDWKYCDSCLTYDGRNATATTLRLSSSTGWTEADTLTLTASASMFVGNSDIGDGALLQVTLPVVDEVTGVTVQTPYKIRVRIVEYVSATAVRVESVGTVPEQLRNVATVDWVLLRDTISGLDHLEGREVAILSDGSSHPRRVVVDGKVSLESPGGVVTVGLPYRAHIETLELNVPGGNTIRDAKKLLSGVGMLVQDTVGIYTCGGDLDPDRLDPLPQRQFEPFGEPTRPMTGYVHAPVDGNWDENSGRFHIISDDPLPMTILALIPRFVASDRTS